jgi:YbbR domain-containing protein
MAWRELITRNLGWKLSSLVLATLVWLAIYTNSGSNVRLSAIGRGGVASRSFPKVPVSVRVPATCTWRWQVEPTEVALTVSGDPKLVQTLRANDLEVVVDLTGLEDFTTVQWPPRVAAPDGIVIEDVKPPSIRVKKIDGTNAPASSAPAL